MCLRFCRCGGKLDTTALPSAAGKYLCLYDTAVTTNFLEYFRGVMTLRYGFATRGINTAFSEDIFYLKFIKLQCLFQFIRFDKLPKMDAYLFDHFHIGDGNNAPFVVLFVHPFPDLGYSFMVFGNLFASL